MFVSFTYTLQAAQLPFIGEKCLRKSPNSIGQRPERFAPGSRFTTVETRFSGIKSAARGIIPFTPSQLSSQAVTWPRDRNSNSRGIASDQSLKRHEVHPRGLASPATLTITSCTTPGMLAVILAWARRDVGMRMIPASTVQFLSSAVLRVAHILRRTEKRLCGESSRDSRAEEARARTGSPYGAAAEACVLSPSTPSRQPALRNISCG